MVLAADIEIAVQLWTMNNYHYYLKQELFPHGSSRFHAISWHPEHALTLYLAAAGEYLRTAREDGEEG